METISVLQALYSDEILISQRYMAYARKADSEDYPNIAKLFLALANSESIHARRFKEILSASGAGIREIPVSKIEILSTKRNLRRAAWVELEEIDRKYPLLIQKIQPEKHDEAIRRIAYAWESEKQHRNLIAKIQSGTGIFFRLLTQKIEARPAQFFVCQDCGSTCTAIPTAVCPICGTAPSNYKKIGAGD